MAKAARVKAALERDGWQLIRQVGSHCRYRKGKERRTFSYHDSEDLGNPALARVAKTFGYTLDELRRMV
jgi:predicted RNA binding protein YcfA (HicA-like mRNA interferase family)